MNHASEILVTGVLPRDAEASVTPKGVRVSQFDLALDEDGSTVYVPVRAEIGTVLPPGELPRIGDRWRFRGHLWRDLRTARNPYPPLILVANWGARCVETKTGSLFAEAKA